MHEVMVSGDGERDLEVSSVRGHRRNNPHLGVCVGGG